MRCIRPFKKEGVEFGCGQCNACRIDKARLWTSRVLLEQRLHDRSCFITLTYSEDTVPLVASESLVVECQKEVLEDGTILIRSLCRDDITEFFKRLRYHAGDQKVRYFGCGEYGDKSGRPHYHICFFGLGIEDAWIVEKAWGLGNIDVQELNQGTAGYCSQYVVKKWTNKRDRKLLDLLAGREVEFPLFSTKPGIGAGAADIIADALKDRSCTSGVPAQLRMDGVMRPLGRYIKNRIKKKFWNEEEIDAFEKTIWLQSVYEEKVQQMQAAKEKGITPEKYRWELRRQRFLNLVTKKKMFKRKGVL